VEEVSRVNTHAGTRLAVLSERCFRWKRQLFEPPRSDSRATLLAGVGAFRTTIQKQEILFCVIGNEQIHPAIVVDIRGCNPNTFTQKVPDIRSPLNRSEGAISIVVVKETRCALEHARQAVVVEIRPIVVTKGAFRFPVINIAADEQVQPAVVIIVEPDRARSLQSRITGDICERVVAVVPVKDAVAVGRHEEIGPAIVVVVSYSHSHAKRATATPAASVTSVNAPSRLVAVKRVA
jgi:hypothetical protein